MKTDTKPIGYWLTHLHNLIEAGFETDIGIGRRSWQVIHLMAQDGAVHSRDELVTALEPFWKEPVGPTPDEVLDRLTAEGRLAVVPHGFQLTATGRAEHDQIWERVTATRARLMTGLTAEDYTRTLHVLATMAKNLEQRVQG